VARVRLTDASLKRVGVLLMDPRSVRLICLSCCQMWTPEFLARKRLPRGWWKCPNGCKSGTATVTAA
jgi:hypothetical protein